MKHISLIRSVSPVFGLAALLALSGCGRQEAKVVTVPKEKPEAPVAALPPGHPEMGSMGAMPANANMGMDPSMRPRLTYKVPQGWTESDAGSIRVASFRVSADGKNADMSVIPLGGGAGGDVANVNRWRGQVGLEPLSAAALKATAEKVEIAGQPAELYDLAGTNPGSGEPMRVLGAIQHRDGLAWFFKLSGDSDLVAAQKPALIEFMKTVEFHPPAMALPTDHPPVGGMSMTPADPGGPISREGQPNWTVPAGWTEVTGGQFLIGKFTITGANNQQASVNVSASAGDGGGFAANVNRWRRQVGLAEQPEADIVRGSTTVELTGTKATFVDISGTDPRSNEPTRVIGAMVPQGGQTWFYKLSGNASLVAAQREAFENFVKSVKY